MKIYTRTGDAGETSLIGGSRISKTNPRIDAYGTVDELNAFIGLARVTLEEPTLDGQLDRIQADLFEIGAELASVGDEKPFSGVGHERITALELAIDTMDKELDPLRNFILPGGCQAAATLHVARTICRRAERKVIHLRNEVSVTTVVYLNRLSDLLFVAARWANQSQNIGDRPWNRD